MYRTRLAVCMTLSALSVLPLLSCQKKSAAVEEEEFLSQEMEPPGKSEPVRKTGWISAKAMEQRAHWDGNPFRPLKMHGKRIPNPAAPWVFFSNPPSCPKVVGGWFDGRSVYWLHITEVLPHDFLRREVWSTIKPTGRTYASRYPDIVPRCDERFGYTVKWVEIEYVDSPE